GRFVARLHHCTLSCGYDDNRRLLASDPGRASSRAPATKARPVSSDIAHSSIRQRDLRRGGLGMGAAGKRLRARPSRRSRAVRARAGKRRASRSPQGADRKTCRIDAAPRRFRAAASQEGIGKGGDKRALSSPFLYYLPRPLATAAVYERHDRRKAAEYQPLAVEWHRMGLRVHARIGFHQLHHLRHCGIARRFVRPLDPGEDHFLIFGGIDGTAKIRDLTLGYAVAPALEDA